MSERQPCSVDVRASLNGELTPLRFTWDSEWLNVAQVGRTWSDQQGDHWLVMPAAPALVFELVRAPDGRWQAERQQSEAHVA